MDESQRLTCDSTNLIKAADKACSSSPSKKATKQFRAHEYEQINRAQQELHNRTWQIEKTRPFIISERGHLRKIRGNIPYDRMILHSYIDNTLSPIIMPKLIYDNYASQDGKGTSEARERFAEFLHSAYFEYGTNKFYILLIDFSKFYDNIRHEKLKDSLFKVLPDEQFHHYMIDTILDSMKVDISYMTDQEYEHCLDIKYVALDHLYDDEPGEKFMAKSVDIGNQGSQIFSIYYPSRIDNFCKIKLRIKRYCRYMDDIAIMARTKKQLWDIFAKIKPICADMGLYLNEKKTHIVRADQNFKFLNRIYRLTDSGHLILKLDSSTITRERRRLKKHADLVYYGKKPYEEAATQYKSWITNFAPFMSNEQRKNIDKLFNDLFIKPFIQGDYKHE